MRDDALQNARRRAVLRQLASAGAVGAASLAGMVSAALAADPKNGIRYLKGGVTVDGKPAMAGQAIHPGQTVVTEEDGEVVFVMGEDAFLQRGNTRFAIEDNAGVMVLRYLSGKVLSVFGKGRKTLVTPTASIGIRGTACYIEAEPARTYFCLCYGSAEITPIIDGNKRRVIRTSHHEYPLYIGARRGPLLVSPATAVNHDDAELTMLEALVGRLPPFHGKAYPDM